MNSTKNHKKHNSKKFSNFNKKVNIHITMKKEIDYLCSMKEEKLLIRPAREEDAAIVAKIVAMAIRDEEILCNYCGPQYLDILTEIAKSQHTQYSWRHALIAEEDGQVVGGIVGYDGGQLHSLRENTFAIVRQHTNKTPSTPDETEAGEFYLDSVAVFDPYRNRGIGRALINALCKKVFSEGHQHVGLLVDCDNPRAEILYTSLGFERIDKRVFFGHQMWHLQATQHQ